MAGVNNKREISSCHLNYIGRSCCAQFSMIGLNFNISQKIEKPITVNLQIDECNLIQENRYKSFNN